MPFSRYGVKWPDGYTDIQIHRWCFLNNVTVAEGGLGRYGHFRKASELIWPKLIWHPWAEEKIESLCNPDNAQLIGDVRIYNMSWIGCAGSGKTFDSAHFALNWWMMAPNDTIVILCSTTKIMVKKRTWTEVKKLWNASKNEGVTGHIIPTEFSIHAVDPKAPDNTDERHAVYCIAVKGGKLEEAIANIQGQHARRICIVIDEAPATPEAIYETIPNLRKGCQELIVISSGNPVSRRMDPHGIVSEPAAGWSTVNRETHRWKTKQVKKWQLPSGTCIHFPGRESPNVKAQKTLYPFIYTYEDHLNALELKGEKDLSYWKYDEAFYAPEDVTNTVFSETLISAYDGRGTLKFVNFPVKISALDPAYGGDACIQLFGLMGQLESQRIGIQFTEWLEIKFDITSKDTKEMQIYRQVEQNCRARGITPDHLAVDRTGNGRGIYGYLYDGWSKEVVAVEFGGKPSERPASISDQRPCDEVYDRRVTELWFAMLEFLKGRQIGGLYPEMIVELCTREYDIATRKYRVIDKLDMKKKLGYSPDHADAGAVLLELARNLGAMPVGVGLQKSNKKWLDIAQRFNRVYSDDQRAQPELSLYYR